MCLSVAELKLRWDFLMPWVKELDRQVKYEQIARPEEVWDAEKRVLKVTLPAKNSNQYERYTVDQFFHELRRFREALALLAAVAHMDEEGWKFLLGKIWGIKLGKNGSEELEREIPARFVIVLDHLTSVIPEAMSEEHPS
ncbi:unnamed protein product [Phytophthora lilii]|uniref:Unnamed protein product n=1 Tax=Phytophthora lilii TaxID=2077276 RepID=A0A9W6WY28_9STRA|nr:unnamed protein product [Phytophthora lilii]